MVRKVYIDTSVVGGYFDDEFELWTKLFFESVIKGRFKIAISELLNAELLNAPDKVKHFLSSIPEQQQLRANYNDEAKQLANKYLKSNIIGKSSLTDCRHIATATVNEIEILTSWNFKHIVNLDKIHLYNGVNLQNGYRTIEIRSPRELLDYEEN